MSVDPFRGNSNFEKLFQVKSDQSYCELFEVVELYRHVKEGYYVIFRYQVDNRANYMPRRVFHKFTDLMISEVEDNGSRTTLYLTTIFKDLGTASHRVNLCCASRFFVLAVEQKLYEYLL